jgi:hypothetical protein
VLLLGSAVGAYAWDASRSDEIAEGVTVGGVDVGGMTEEEATEAVAGAVVEPLDKRVVVNHGETKYILSSKRIALRADVAGSVESALAASQEGGLPTRLLRYATGGEVEESIEPKVGYDEGEIAAEEAMPAFAQVPFLQKLTGLIYFPITPTFPWLGPLGMMGYLPAKFKIRFLEPIDMAELGGSEATQDKALVQTVAQEVRARIQENLHEMLGERKSVWFG